MKITVGAFVGLAAGASLPFRTVHQFGNATWIENFAVRANGQILANDYSGATLFLVDPTGHTPPYPLHRFANDTCVTGIAEVEPDVFYTQSAIGDPSPYALKFRPNSSVVWEVDMRHYRGGNPPVRQVAKIQNITAPNGMFRGSTPDSILIADSAGGTISSLNVKSGKYNWVFTDPSLQPVTGAMPMFGVNGVAIVGSKLYYTNTNQGLVGTVPLVKGRPAGKPTILSSKTPNADDFAVDKCGNVWLAENVSNTLVRIAPNGTVTTVATQTAANNFYGPVSARFGRGADCHTLYVSTDGLQFNEQGQILKSNGKIVAFDTSTVCSK